MSVALRPTSFDFWNLPKQQERELRKLLAAFKSIDLVSIILRFVQPRFAEALEHVNPGLAAGVASYTFELQIRALADALGEPPRMKLAELIDSLPPGGAVT